MTLPAPPTPAEPAIPSDEQPWLLWGPYLSERQWGTVREDCSASGDAWAAVDHDMSRSFAYRWGEEGIAGISDERQRLCLALSLWNGRDPILKENFFGLSNAQGNHGEDVKEVWHYLDNTPDHRWMAMRYRYPQAAFPYEQLIRENAARDRDQPEYELADTGVFAQNRFFDIDVEIAKPGATEVLLRYTVHNRGPTDETLHLLPTLWFRADPDRPAGEPPCIAGGAGQAIASHCTLGRYALEVEGVDASAWLFTDNSSNLERLQSLGAQGNPQMLPADAEGGFWKDGIHERVVHGRTDAVRSRPYGTRAAAWRQIRVPAGASVAVRARLVALPDSGQLAPAAFGAAFDAILQQRREAADAFYAARQDSTRDAHCLALQRQAWAGLLWNKQYYSYEIRRWLDGDPGAPPPPAERQHGRNAAWDHLRAHDILLMPDKWEYPWFASWDLAFHSIAIAPVDPALAKRQITMLLHDRYMHPNGQLPAYEWNFSDVNPPVHAMAAWKVYQRDAAIIGTPDRDFLRHVLHRLMLNFTWWVNREDARGNNIFEGGFLGLDNVNIFDRSQPLPGGGELEQADGTSWMAMYALNLMRIAMELAQDDTVYEDLAIKFSEHFFHIAGAMANMANTDGLGLWDEEDGFYYDMLRLPDGSARRLKLRTIAGLVPFFAVEVLDDARMEKLQHLRAHLDALLHRRPDLDALVSHWREPSRAPGAAPDDSAAPAAEGHTHLFSLLRGHRMKRVLNRLLDENEFLSPHGLRSVSKAYEADAFDFSIGDSRYALHYTPAESDSGMFGGNSNWRGPVWLPLNFLIVESLRRFHAYYGDEFRVECPTGSGRQHTLCEVADFLQDRLLSLYRPGPDGSLPGNGRPGECADATDGASPAPLLFHEYFHGDTGLGLGAAHQTGWTALLALL
ncbi:glucosidase [Xylophilus rhododendri]|uniref:Glucosidase n=1 Tax=Xylophilus rhododendri TaxID=2697032 RepID=A0A857J1P4_9BURK|nr:glucosidase [Xylophilus rhododendri]QHI97517.1 glucosidase [Xylophilus rhododendri]